MDDNNGLLTAVRFADRVCNEVPPPIPAPKPPSGLATASPDFSPSSRNDGLLWWVAVSIPRLEERLADDIRVAGAEPFLPREEVVRYREGKGRDVYTRVLFPGYVFYRGDRDAAFESSSLLSVLNTSPQDCRDIDNLLLAYSAGPVRRATKAPHELFKVGQRVKVVSGPLKGTDGLVDRFGGTLIYLAVGKFGVAEIDVLRSQIEPLIGD